MTKRFTTDLVREAYACTKFRPLWTWHLDVDLWAACPSTAVARYLGIQVEKVKPATIAVRLGSFGFSPRYVELFNLFWDRPDLVLRSGYDDEEYRAWLDANQIRDLLSDREILSWTDSTENTAAATAAASAAEPGTH